MAVNVDTVAGTYRRLRATRVLTTARAGAPFAAFLVLSGAFLLLSSPFDLYIGNLCLLASIAALGLNLLTGTAGQLSIGSAALLAVGAYTSVPLSHHVGFLASVFGGGIAAATVGIIVGFPSLRLRGLYLVFSTLALQYVASFAFQQLQTSQNAISGYSPAAASIAGLVLNSDRKWFVILAITLFLACTSATSLMRGRPGRAWRSIRDHDVAAAVIGVNVTVAKLSAFLVSSFIIGCAGALGAFYLQNVSYETYSLDLAISYVAMIIIGGLGSVWGSVAGAAVVTALPYLVQNVGTIVLGSTSALIVNNLAALDITTYSVIVIAFLLFEPGGLAVISRRLRGLAGHITSLPALGIRAGGRR